MATSTATQFATGDVVRLGETAREKQYVVRVWGDGTVQVRQMTTGKVRNVRADRCVLVSQKATIIKPFDTCPQCGDFYAWCPEHPEMHVHREG